MSEQSFVATLLATSIDFPWKGRHKVQFATELKITKNRVDIVYYQQPDDMEVGTVIAVEAKLRDWRKAIQQAYRDKLFANHTYVALPEQFASSALSNIEEFQRADVGLITLNVSGEAQIHHDPTFMAPISLRHSDIAKRSLETLTHV